MSYKLSKRSMKQLIGVYPELAFANCEAIKITKQDFGIISNGGIRLDKQQAYMYAQGRTREGNKITWTLDSYHQYGLATDLVAYHRGKFTWKAKYYPPIIKAMKIIIKAHGLDIDNGFDLWEKDMPHWQMTGMKPYYDIRKIQ